MAADWGNLQSVYGLDQATINSLQKSGYSADQASQLLQLSVGSNQSSPGINLSTIGGSGISPQTLAGLANLLKGGGGGSGGQGSGTPVNPGGVDPNQPMTNLGAAALNQRAIYNATPGGQIDPKSGVSNAPTTPTVSDVVPKVPKGPWSTTPSVFTQAPNLAPTAAAPVRPTPQATAVPFTPGQSFATPPPAPGITIGGPGGSAAGVVPMQMGQPQAMGGGGQGQPQAMGGGPNWARTPGSGALPSSPPQNWAGAGQVPPPVAAPSGAAAGGGAVALANSLGIKKMAPGGIVTQPTFALIGEKGPEAVVPLGGSGDDKSLKERPAPMNATGQQTGYSGGKQPPAAPSDSYQSDRPRRGLQASGVPQINHSSFGGDSKAGAVYDASGNLVTSNSNLTAQAAAGSGATMMPGGGVRDPSGLVYDSSANLTAQDVGGAGATMPGGGGAAGGGMSPQMSAGLGAISSIGQNLGSAIAGSVGSWKMQPSAIPDPSSFAKSQPQYNFQTPSA